MARDDTRSALIETGKRMIYATGFNHTGIQAILSEAEVPKGSFYHYFKSKDDFGLAVIEDFAAANRKLREEFLGDTAFSPLTRLRRYFEHYVAKYETCDFAGGCLFGNLGQELSDQNEAFRLRVAEGFRSWSAGLADCLRQAQAAGEISADWDANTLADFCLTGWQGALLRMKVTKSKAPLELFVSVTFDQLLKK